MKKQQPRDTDWKFTHNYIRRNETNIKHKNVQGTNANTVTKTFDKILILTFQFSIVTAEEVRDKKNICETKKI